ncbi:MAG: sugar phosphate isomerase/epimerase [Oscillospiraceae bacterium]|nr:sugar phosphate isomerase/epimerase [Oscillospiraceae bacterium]
MRLGAPVFDKYETGEEWALLHQKYGYRAAYSPINSKNDLDKKDDFIKAAEKYDIIIAEVGAWSNPMSLDAEERKKNIEHCKNQLFVADEIGAECCVNIAGNLGERWDGHSNKNLTKEAFDLIVETTREIIDSIKPKRTFYTLEMMPWMYPTDEDSYLDLIKAVDREHFAAHIDIANTINSPVRYYSTPDIIKSCFKKLGRYIRSIHVKDIFMSQDMTTHISEIIAGKGNFNHRCLIEEVRKLNKDIPLMLEHLASKEEYIEAGDYIKSLF